MKQHHRKVLICWCQVRGVPNLHTGLYPNELISSCSRSKSIWWVWCSCHIGAISLSDGAEDGVVISRRFTRLQGTIITMEKNTIISYLGLFNCDTVCAETSIVVHTGLKWKGLVVLTLFSKVLFYFSQFFRSFIFKKIPCWSGINIYSTNCIRMYRKRNHHWVSNSNIPPVPGLNIILRYL